MIRTTILVLVMALVLGACEKRQLSGQFAGTADTSNVTLKQFDQTMTYYVDPRLDHLVVTFECGLFESLTYDFGDIVGTTVRETFDRRFTDAVEVPYDEAEFIVAYATTWASFKSQTTLFTVNVEMAFQMVLATIEGRGAEAEYLKLDVPRKFKQDGSYCAHVNAMMSSITPDLMRLLAIRLGNRIIGH